GWLAAWMTRDGRELEALPQTPEEIRERFLRAGSERLVDSYSQFLQRGANESSRPEIARILERTRELLDHGTPGDREQLASERENFRRELLAHLYGSADKIGEQIRAKQKETNGVLAENEVRAMTEAGYEADPHLKATCAVALLLLASP